MTKKVLAQIIAATAGIWIASLFIPGAKVELLPSSNFFGIDLTAIWQIYLILGITLGLLNFFVKPLLNLVTLPLRIITLGLFGFVVNVGLIWFLDIVFEEFSAPLLYPLLWTTLIIWGISVIVSMIFRKEE